MTSTRKLVIEPLERKHDRDGFRCNSESLNTYIAKQAGQDIKRRISRVFVATDLEEPKAILGYYTLSALSVDLSILPPALAKKLPRHPIPAALLGRLAVSTENEKQGIGELLLADAVKRCLVVGEEIAIYALIANPIDTKAAAFYKKFGFLSFGKETKRLFLPLKSI